MGAAMTKERLRGLAPGIPRSAKIIHPRAPEGPGIKDLTIVSFKGPGGLTERYTFARHGDGFLFKRGLPDRFGIHDHRRFGGRSDGHGHGNSKGYRDDAWGSGERLGLRGRPWRRAVPRSPLSPRAEARATSAVAAQATATASSLTSMAAQAQSGKATWGQVALTAERLRADVVRLEATSLDLAHRARGLSLKGTTGAQAGLIASARQASAAAVAATKAARVATEKATVAAHRAAEQAAKAARAAAEATARTARAAAEAAARTARVAAEVAAKAARAAAEATAKAAIATAKATAAVAAGAISVLSGGR